jgi:hypothetical protein
LATSRKKYSALIWGPVADPGAAVGEALLLAIPDELGEVLGRIAGMDGEDIRAQRHDGDGAQVVGREAFVFGGGLANRK